MMTLKQDFQRLQPVSHQWYNQVGRWINRMIGIGDMTVMPSTEGVQFAPTGNGGNGRFLVRQDFVRKEPVSHEWYNQVGRTLNGLEGTDIHITATQAGITMAYSEGEDTAVASLVKDDFEPGQPVSHQWYNLVATLLNNIVGIDPLQVWYNRDSLVFELTVPTPTPTPTPTSTAGPTSTPSGEATATGTGTGTGTGTATPTTTPSGLGEYWCIKIEHWNYGIDWNCQGAPDSVEYTCDIVDDFDQFGICIEVIHDVETIVMTLISGPWGENPELCQENCAEP